MSKILNSGYIGDDDGYLVECDQCGNDFFTDDRSNHFCGKKCYKDAKFEYEEE